MVDTVLFRWLKLSQKMVILLPAKWTLWQLNLQNGFFNESLHGKKIILKEGPALDTLKKLSGSFDMAFIDADKENYLNYYEVLLPIMRPGGLIVVDNVLWSGRVLNPKEPSDHAIHRFNQRVMHDHRVEKVMLTIRDGVSLLRKH